jgi:5-methylcytosine-specific restriction protein A
VSIRDVERAIGRDLAALEGMDAERLAKVKRRAAWIADRFIRERQKAGMITCDACTFDPSKLAAELGVKPRGFLDVHHKNPLDEGVRYTTTADFALLCPTCHRAEHVRLRTMRPVRPGR